jgi:hypothetical protein
VTVSPTENTSLSKKVTVFALKKWAVRKIDRIRRSFFLEGGTGAASANGGHCQVLWLKATRPKLLEGLSILDLERFSRALRGKSKEALGGDCCTLETSITFVSLFYFP